MPALMPDSNWILLASADDLAEDFWSNCMDQLPRHVARFPAITPFVDAIPRRRSTRDLTEAELTLRLNAGYTMPRLVILDARLKANDATRSANGKAALDLLQWLESHSPSTPVLIVAQDLPEALQQYALERQNIFVWNDKTGREPDSAMDFARVLTCLEGSAARLRRRLIIEVEESSVKYRVQVGPHEFSSPEAPYKSLSRVKALVDRIERFRPYHDNQVDNEWLPKLSDVGKDVFSALVADNLGAPIVNLIRGACKAQATPGSSIYEGLDLRFEINVSGEGPRLFSLPFELGTNYDDDRFLCHEVPMARRLHLDEPRPRGQWDEPPRRSPVRMLFVNAAMGGTIELKPEEGGAALPSQYLDPLGSIAEERRALDELVALSGGRLIVEEIRLDDENALTGQLLQDRIESLLTTGRFDIFHFSGHSLTFGQTTILVLPGQPGEGWKLSIRAVGNWMYQGDCKLLVLSSCSGASLRTALEVMRAGASGVLGFRWEVEEKSCVRYIKRFYNAYLDPDHPMTLPDAYRHACAAERGDAGESPTWASAVAVVRD